MAATVGVACEHGCCRHASPPVGRGQSVQGAIRTAVSWKRVPVRKTTEPQLGQPQCKSHLLRLRAPSVLNEIKNILRAKKAGKSNWIWFRIQNRTKQEEKLKPFLWFKRLLFLEEESAPQVLGELCMLWQCTCWHTDRIRRDGYGQVLSEAIMHSHQETYKLFNTENKPLGHKRVKVLVGTIDPLNAVLAIKFLTWLKLHYSAVSQRLDYSYTLYY